MFAIIETGGKQYRVSANQKLTVEKLGGNVGDKVTLDKVLMVGGDKAKLGAPHVAGASVVAEIVEQLRGDKVVIFKKKRRHNYRRKRGHRQYLTTLKVTGINL